MSKTAVGPETTTLSVPYRFSTEQFDKMVDAGAFGEDDVESLGRCDLPDHDRERTSPAYRGAGCRNVTENAPGGPVARA